jgi:hypothetical protein
MQSILDDCSDKIHSLIQAREKIRTLQKELESAHSNERLVLEEYECAVDDLKEKNPRASAQFCVGCGYVVGQSERAYECHRKGRGLCGQTGSMKSIVPADEILSLLDEGAE